MSEYLLKSIISIQKTEHKVGNNGWKWKKMLVNTDLTVLIP